MQHSDVFIDDEDVTITQSIGIATGGRTKDRFGGSPAKGPLYRRHRKNLFTNTELKIASQPIEANASKTVSNFAAGLSGTIVEKPSTVRTENE